MATTSPHPPTQPATPATPETPTLNAAPVAAPSKTPGAAHETKQAPGWFIRWFLKVPPLAYRVGLAKQAGRRFLLLTTTGRETGRPRTCGLNYVQDGGATYVFSGWGTGADWYRNLRRDPAVTVQIGTQRWAGVATPVTDPAARRRLVALMAERGQEQGPPRRLRPMLRLIGFDYDAELRQSAARGETMPVVMLRPVESGSDPALR